MVLAAIVMKYTFSQKGNEDESDTGTRTWRTRRKDKENVGRRRNIKNYCQHSRFSFTAHGKNKTNKEKLEGEGKKSTKERIFRKIIVRVHIVFILRRGKRNTGRERKCSLLVLTLKRCVGRKTEKGEKKSATRTRENFKILHILVVLTIRRRKKKENGERKKKKTPLNCLHFKTEKWKKKKIEKKQQVGGRTSKHRRNHHSHILSISPPLFVMPRRSKNRINDDSRRGKTDPQHSYVGLVSRSMPVFCFCDEWRGM